MSEVEISFGSAKRGQLSRVCASCARWNRASEGGVPRRHDFKSRWNQGVVELRPPEMRLFRLKLKSAREIENLSVMAEMENRKRSFAICAALGFLTLLAFWPLKNCDFVNFDDPDYVTSNPHVQDGLTWHSALWAFQTDHSANWHPLTWLSLMLDSRLYGVGAGGYHVTNVVLHLANALLLFAVLGRMTGGIEIGRASCRERV